jgi:hypothetical protein
MTKLDKYLSLKKKVESAQQEVNQAEGAIGELMKQLEHEFGCKTLKEAKQKLKYLVKQEQSSKKAFDDAVDAFEEKWGDL